MFIYFHSFSGLRRLARMTRRDIPTDEHLRANLERRMWIPAKKPTTATSSSADKRMYIPAKKPSKTVRQHARDLLSDLLGQITSAGNGGGGGKHHHGGAAAGGAGTGTTGEFKFRLLPWIPCLRPTALTNDRPSLCYIRNDRHGCGQWYRNGDWNWRWQ